jgi:hypothetical protein
MDSSLLRSEKSIQDSLCGRAESLEDTRSEDYYRAAMACGRARFINGDFRGAADTFTALLGKKTGDPVETGGWAVRSLLAADIPDEAMELIPVIREAGAGDSLYSTLLLSVCSVLMDQGDSRSAAQLIDQILIAMPDSASCYVAVSFADILKKAGRPQEADSLLRHAGNYCGRNPAFEVQGPVARSEGPKQGPYWLKLGDFRKRDAAGSLVDRLESYELNASLVSQNGRYYLELGPFEDLGGLEETATLLRELKILDFETVSQR